MGFEDEAFLFRDRCCCRIKEGRIRMVRVADKSMENKLHLLGSSTENNWEDKILVSRMK